MFSTLAKRCIFYEFKNVSVFQKHVQILLRASAWETGADLKMRVGRFHLKLAHKLVMWTYVICQVSGSRAIY